VLPEYDGGEAIQPTLASVASSAASASSAAAATPASLEGGSPAAVSHSSRAGDAISTGPSSSAPGAPESEIGPEVDGSKLGEGQPALSSLAGGTTGRGGQGGPVVAAEEAAAATPTGGRSERRRRACRNRVGPIDATDADHVGAAEAASAR
ncbi:unnamed protein product, partial [Laminaria digitata]